MEMDQKSSQDEKVGKKVCSQFLKGKCIKDLNCPFLHVKPDQTAHRQPVQKPEHKSLQGATPEARIQIERKLEFDSLKTKYKDELAIDEDKSTGITTLVVNHPITDPDFPWDLPFLLLEFSLPSGYPTEPLACRMLNAEIPSEIVTKIDSYLNYNAKLLKGTCCIKSLISMLEKNLESLMITKPAVSSSIKIITFPATTKGAEKKFESLPEPGSAVGLPSTSLLRSISNPVTRSVPIAMPGGFTQQSTQVSCELKNWKGISTALLLQFSLQLQCPKCRTHLACDDMLPSCIYTVKCPKCDKQFIAQFFAEYLHQTSPNLCFLQLKGSPVPLSISKCNLQLECDECEDYMYQDKLLNIVHISNVNAGDELRSSCRKCQQKMIFCMTNITFKSPSLPSSLGAQVKPQKIAGLVIGQPLPELGTCKHYKKSFRWLRFPCCGKVFPCDTCHDEGTSDGHASVWANRMICGHCSRESVFSNSKCVCGNYPTDQRHTTYWEGGKGSRNQATMSKKDSRKFKGMNK